MFALAPSQVVIDRAPSANRADDKIHLRPQLTRFFFSLANIEDKGSPLSTSRGGRGILRTSRRSSWASHLVRELVSRYRRKRGNVPRNKFCRRIRFISDQRYPDATHLSYVGRYKKLED